MISLRVSEEEYTSLMQVYRSHGARSLSDFARLAMVKVGGFHGDAPDLYTRVEQLHSRLADLETRFQSFQEREP